jgi:hypothetical protein
MSTILVSPLIIEELDSENVEVNLNDVSTYLMNPGQPMLPKIVKSVELEFGVSNVQINVIPKNVKVYEIEKKIRPAPMHVILSEDKQNIAEVVLMQIMNESHMYPFTFSL